MHNQNAVLEVNSAESGFEPNHIVNVTSLLAGFKQERDVFKLMLSSKMPGVS